MPASVTLIGEAVFARCLSAIKEERVRASKALCGPQKEPFRGDKQQFIDDLEQALYASKIISYTQGFMLMRETANEVNINTFLGDRLSDPVHDRLDGISTMLALPECGEGVASSR
jgi:6-phosphogluconate dehydrogenase